MSWRRLFWMIPAIVVVTAIVAWRWLLYSESGAAWALGMATDATDGAIQAEVVEGSIAGGLTIRGFSFDNEKVRVDVADVELIANPGLFPLSVTIRSAQVRDVVVEVRSSDAETEEATDIRDVLR